MSEQTIEVESWSKVSRSSSEAIIEVEFSSRVSKSLLRMLKHKSTFFLTKIHALLANSVSWMKYSNQASSKCRDFRSSRNACATSATSANIEVACRNALWLSRFRLSRFRRLFSAIIAVVRNRSFSLFVVRIQAIDLRVCLVFCLQTMQEMLSRKVLRS